LLAAVVTLADKERPHHRFRIGRVFSKISSRTELSRVRWCLVQNQPVIKITYRLNSSSPHRHLGEFRDPLIVLKVRQLGAPAPAIPRLFAPFSFSK
jgi:hypothetical protein